MEENAHTAWGCCPLVCLTEEDLRTLGRDVHSADFTTLIQTYTQVEKIAFVSIEVPLEKRRSNKKGKNVQTAELDDNDLGDIHSGLLTLNENGLYDVIDDNENTPQTIDDEWLEKIMYLVIFRVVKRAANKNIKAPIFGKKHVNQTTFEDMYKALDRVINYRHDVIFTTESSSIRWNKADYWQFCKDTM